MAKAHIGTRIDEAQNSQTLQGKIPSDFLAVGGKAVDANKLDGLDSTQFLRSDANDEYNGTLTMKSASSPLILQAFGGNHTYITLNARDGSTVRSGWIGYGSDGTTSLSVTNDLGDIYFHPKSGSKAFVGLGEILNSTNLASFLVTQSTHGVMSSTDKVKLDGIQSGAINQTHGDGRYLRFSGGEQKIIGGRLVIDNTGYDTHLQLKRTNTSIDYGVSITPSTDGYVHFLPLSGTVGYKFTGKVTVDGDVVSSTAMYNGVNINSLNNTFNSHVGSGGSAHATATPSAHGFMSNADKSKLDAIQSSAINQTTADGRYLKLAGGTVTGGLVLKDTLSIDKSSTHIQLKEANVNKWHIESIGGLLKIVETGVSTRLTIDSGKATFNTWEMLHAGNIGAFLATTSAHGFMSSSDKSKINGIASGAEVNQNAFSHIAVSGNATVNANSKMSTLTFIAGAGININTDSSGMTVTLASAVADDFVKKIGDEMSGNLTIANSLPRLHLKAGTNQDSEIYFTEDLENHGIRMKYFGSDTNEFQLNGRNGGVETIGLTMSRAVGTNDLKYKGYTIYHSGNSTPASETDLSNHVNDTSIHKNWGLWSTNGARDLKVYSKRALVGYDTSEGNKLVLNYGGDFGNGVESWGNLNVTGSLTTSALTTTNGRALIQTSTGYVDIGSQSTTHAHFYTDRSSYYFNAEIRVDSGLIGSYNEDLQLRASSVTRMTIKESNGYVGIGTTAPNEKLHVDGGIRADGKVTIASDVGNEPNYSSGQLELKSHDGSDIVLGFHRSGSTATSLMHTGESGQLAITTTSPSDRGRLEVKATEFRATSTSNGFKVEYNDSEKSLDFIFM